MRFQKVSLLVVVACLAIFVSYKVFTADPAGYCATQGRYISDKEFIQTAIQLREEDWKKGGGVQKWKDGNRQSGRDFNPQNDNCCRVIRKGTLSTFNRIFDQQEVSVELNNETSVRAIHGANLNDRVFFDVCGELKGHIEYDWQAQ